MKEYSDYMSRISGGDRLRKKIMARVALSEQEKEQGDEQETPESPSKADNHWYTMSSPKERRHKPPIASDSKRKTRNNATRKGIKGIIALAACAAALVIAVLVVPAMLNRPAVIVPDDENLPITGSYPEQYLPEQDPEQDLPVTTYNESHTPGLESDADATYYESSAPVIEARTEANYALTFNPFYRIGFRGLPGYPTPPVFITPLTDLRIAALFPGMEAYIEWAGITFYTEDRSVWEISATISQRVSLRISSREFSVYMEFSPEGSAPWPELSYVHGVPVVAGVYDTRRAIDAYVPFEFVAEFEHGGLFYWIETSQTVEAGEELLTYLVNQIISAAPLNFDTVTTVELMPSEDV